MPRHATESEVSSLNDLPDRKVVPILPTGKATWMFSHTFRVMPVLKIAVFDPAASSAPCFIEAKEWVMTDTLFAGVKLQAFRGSKLPALDPLANLLSVLGINTALGKLSLFDAFAGTDFTGVQAHICAGLPTT